MKFICWCAALPFFHTTEKKKPPLIKPVEHYFPSTYGRWNFIAFTHSHSFYFIIFLTLTHTCQLVKTHTHTHYVTSSSFHSLIRVVAVAIDILNHYKLVFSHDYSFFSSSLRHNFVAVMLYDITLWIGFLLNCAFTSDWLTIWLTHCLMFKMKLYLYTLYSYRKRHGKRSTEEKQCSLHRIQCSFWWLCLEFCFVFYSG